MEIRIALTNLGKYNEGKLAFEWLDLPCTEGKLEEVKKRIGINERYEEWFITDYEAPEGFEIGEYENLEYLNDLANRLADIDEVNYLALLEHTGSKEEALDIAESGDYSFYSDVADDSDLGWEYADYLEIPDHIQMYFNYEAYGRDCRINEGGSHTPYGYIVTY